MSFATLKGLHPLPTAITLAMSAFLAGCATPGGPAGTGKPAANATATSATTAAGPGTRPAGTAAALGTPQPFAEVTKDAKSTAGYFPVWTKDEKTWLEIPADRLDQPFFFGGSLASGLGERGFWPGLTGAAPRMAVLRRVGSNIQLVARNLQNRAPAGTPLSRAVEESYSDSLIAVAPLAAAPHPERKSLLVDAFVLLGGDIPGTLTQLEATYRLPYAQDRANSSIERVRTDADSTSVTVRSHFALARLPAPPVFAPGAPPPNPAALPNPPRVVPDARSLFLSYTYNLAPLPAEPMKTRVADQRVGFFTTPYNDLSDDNSGDRRTHLVRRWRLEKKDPAAAVSEPKTPIRVVMDRNIPERWRTAVGEGILEWNKAFERAGFKSAIAVEQQAADADWTSLEGSRVLAVRWFALEGPGATAVGPSQSDPRTGEMLRGAAIIPENWARLERSRVREVLPAFPTQPAFAAFGAGAESQCNYAENALDEITFGAELLNLRGELDPKSPQGERYIAQALKDVTMHEVGHALGLRHNFRASVGINRAQLRDPKFTAEQGISNSVMDYNGLNLPLAGETTADYQMLSLGAYDYWAIEYGYKEIPAATERQELTRIAARGETDPRLAYASDEDVGGIDPLVNQRDLGDDPLAHAQRQIKLAHELWKREQARRLPADDDLTQSRRNLQRGLAFVASAVPVAAKHVGGVVTTRALAGSQQPLLKPVDVVKQREALELVLGEVFNSASFRFDPTFMSRLGVDQFDRNSASTDFSLAEAVLGIQRNALDAMMADGLAVRLADAETKVADPKALLSYAEVQSRLSAAAWSELSAKGGKAGKTGTGEIDSLRRNLQREHLRRLAGGILRPTSAVAADVRAVHRQTALTLQSRLKAALSVGGWSPTAGAHLADSLALLSEALKAPLTRQGV